MTNFRSNVVVTVLGVCAGLFCTAVFAQDYSSSVTKYVRFQAGDDVQYGIVEGGQVLAISGDLFGSWEKTDTTYDVEDVTILVPTEPSKVIALAVNYKSHAGESLPPSIPQAFFKVPSCLQRHEGNIELPTDNVHYEAEMVLVIGKRAQDVEESEALDYVLGVTCGNDISARDWQGNDTQWWRAKAADTFGPCGPFIVSGLDYDNLQLELRVNGERKQESNTNLLVHGVAKLVSFISKHITLEPGDLIFTGTPGTTEALHPGDIVEVELEGVGILRNTVLRDGE